TRWPTRSPIAIARKSSASARTIRSRCSSSNCWTPRRRRLRTSSASRPRSRKWSKKPCGSPTRAISRRRRPSTTGSISRTVKLGRSRNVASTLADLKSLEEDMLAQIDENGIREITYRQALQEALTEEMTANENVILMGEDIGAYGGSYVVTRGFQEEWGRERVIDTPISELGMTGVATGAAIAGIRPVLEIMTINFSLLAMDQIVNHAAKISYM